MEIILAIVIGVAVIFFGALISMGNERQKKAIDNLREQVVLWSMQDLKIKRERLAQKVQIDDPMDWLNKQVGKVCSFESSLQFVEAFDSPVALVCTSVNGGNKIIISPSSPSEIRRMMREKQSRLSQYADRNPLLALPRKISIHEISVLNGGILFDLELSIVWNKLTGQNVEHMERIWVYKTT